jgi:hypothetical protein
MASGESTFEQMFGMTRAQARREQQKIGLRSQNESTKRFSIQENRKLVFSCRNTFPVPKTSGDYLGEECTLDVKGKKMRAFSVRIMKE